jgi:hypothetical protein
MFVPHRKNTYAPPQPVNYFFGVLARDGLEMIWKEVVAEWSSKIPAFAWTY